MWFDKPMPRGWGTQEEWAWHCYRNQGPPPMDEDAREGARVWAAAAATVPPLPQDAPRVTAPRTVGGRAAGPRKGDRRGVDPVVRKGTPTKPQQPAGPPAWKERGLSPEQRRKLIIDGARQQTERLAAISARQMGAWRRERGAR